MICARGTLRRFEGSHNIKQNCGVQSNVLKETAEEFLLFYRTEVNEHKCAPIKPTVY